MPRYIDADMLRNKVKMETNPYGKPTLEYASGLKVLTMIDKQLTADVAEVKHGEWEVCSDEYEICASEFVCSICKESFVSSELTDEQFFQMMKYCPNCGAKMGGERKDK